MSPEKQSSAEEAFRALDAQLAALRAASKSLRDDRPSWSDNIFHPGRRARQEADFGAAVVSALKQFDGSVRTLLAQQESKLAELERQISELKAGQLEGLERVKREQTGAAELREQVEQVARDHEAKVQQLAAGQKDLANEFRERIQQLLDEQRVSIRQLALKASEDAVLSDRARRATELKLEELAKRLPPAPPA